jgi:hypothetical protein
VEVDIIVKFRTARNRPIRVVTLVGAQFDEFTEDWNQGDKKSVVSLPGKYLRQLEV